jgi:hypothetical protein
LKNTNVAALIAGLSMMFAWSMPSAAADPAAPTTCKDGTTSTATGRGACSGHGGVQKGAKPSAATTAAATVAGPAASNTDPAGATAKCKDGTYSKSQHHSGTCSSHGGVAEWLTAKP